MLFIINKEKLSAYVVSIVTVLVLFVMAGTTTPKTNTIETGTCPQNEPSTNNYNTTKNIVVNITSKNSNSESLDNNE